MSATERAHVLVLAAGLGRRMGTPKALMPISGRPWWQHQAARLSEITAGAPWEVTWVVSPFVRAAMTSAGGERLGFVEVDPSRPMFCSVLSGLDSLRASPPAVVFVLPVDCPAPGPAVWRVLAASGGVAVPVRRGVGGHPLCIPWEFVRSSIDPAVRAEPSPERLRLDAIVQPVARRLEVDDAAVGVNLNTPRDVDSWTGRAP